jgi:transposase InsO family protein/transposase-like protein
MQHQGQTTTFQQRLEMADLSAAGYTDLHIARSIGCSISTVRKWRRLFEKKGRIGLSPHLGRPPTGIFSKASAELKQTIIQLRKAHPGWGPTTLLVALGKTAPWASSQLPSRAVLAAFLKQCGLTRHYQPHTALVQPPKEPLVQPHQEWQLDAQGSIEVSGVGKVSLITIIDVVSRLKVESYPSLEHRNPSLPEYQMALRRAFLNHGLPKRITLDHGTVFYDNTTPSPFPTKLHLWLIGLGIEVSFTRKRQPTDHAMIERTHQIMTKQALLGQTYDSQDRLWSGLDERREVLNTELPVRSFKKAPLEAYPQAKHSGRLYQPQWEADLLDLPRIGAYLSQGRWFRRVKGNGHFALGGSGYYIGNCFIGKMLEIRFEPAKMCLQCQPEGSQEVLELPVQGLSKFDLMGELGQLQALPAYQLVLPFSAQEQRYLQYAEQLSVTT